VSAKAQLLMELRLFHLPHGARQGAGSRQLYGASKRIFAEMRLLASGQWLSSDCSFGQLPALKRCQVPADTLFSAWHSSCLFSRSGRTHEVRLQ